MNRSEILESYIHLCDTIDSKQSNDEQFTQLTLWVRDIFSVTGVCLLKRIDSSDGNTGFLPVSCSDSLLTGELKDDYKFHSLLYRDIAFSHTKSGAIFNAGKELSDYLASLTDRNGEVTFLPIKDDVKDVLGALMLISDTPIKLTLEDEFFLKVLSLKIQSLLFSETGGKEKNLAIFLKEAEAFNLTAYTMDLKGNFLYLSPGFLSLLGFSDALEVSAYGSIYLSREAREKELNTILKTGSIKDYRLTLKTREGKTVTVRESALLRGNRIVCILYDITEFVLQQDELNESLEMQQFLNDRIFDTIGLLQKTQVTAIKTLARLAEYRDQETGDHLQRIREYCKILSAEVYRREPYSFKISQGYSNDMYLSSMLHDIGKVGVPDNILLKPGKLNETEWTIMQNHTLWGWAILSEADKELGEQSFLTLAAIIALHHHERYDGTGYPKALKGEDIPLSARIAAIADVYDALTSKRTYKDAWTHQQTVEELIKQKGKQFDPILIDIFIDIEQQFFKIRNNFPE